MPGLLRGVARTAVVAGTAAHVAGGVSHRQQKKYAAQDQSAAEQAQDTDLESQPASSEDTIAQLKQWTDLKDKGIITQEDFDIKKKELLGT